MTLAETNEATKNRQRWLSVLAKSREADVLRLWRAVGVEADFSHLRAPETGLVMTRGRMGGAGDAFNLGEITVTRCSVQLSDGAIGHGYVAGRSKDHAQATAIIDALMQGEAGAGLEEAIIAPLEAMLENRREAGARKAAATKVDFFTMSRTANPK